MNNLPPVVHAVDVLEDCAQFLAFLASWAAAIAAVGEGVEENNAIQAPEAFEFLFKNALAWETKLRDASRQLVQQCACFTAEPQKKM